MKTKIIIGLSIVLLILISGCTQKVCTIEDFESSTIKTIQGLVEIDEEPNTYIHTICRKKECSNCEEFLKQIVR